MKLSVMPEGALSIESSRGSLRGLRPVINGAPLDDARTTLLEGPAQGGHARAIRLQFTSPALGGAVFSVEARQDDPARCALRYWLEGWPGERPLDSFGVCFEQIENARAWLRTGYFSWDGSGYVALDEATAGDSAPTGYAMTQLLPRDGAGSVVIGFDRHDRFQQTLSMSQAQTALSLTILTLWDRRARGAENRCESERLILFEHGQVEEALREWARLVAAASPQPPRPPAAPITGWCSWYNLYAAISEENIREHLAGVAEAARRHDLPMRFFQIDDGFTPEMGDWLEVKPQFPRGMKPLLDEIRAAGFVPGLWIAPFVVGNRSRLYRAHPDWVVTDRQTGGPLALMTFYGEFRWHKRSEEYYILDTTHPDAFAHLRQVFRTWRHEWGCEYFKTDFMHFPTEHGPDRAVWHTAGLTRIEIWRRAAAMIREEIGDATWLGCGCPLWASVGLVDGVRIGRDVGARWTGGQQSAQSLLRDQAARGFANHILWQADPDCILLRERFHHLTAAEQRSLALYAGMGAGVVMTSDALHELSDERLRLWKLLLNPRRAICRFPLLGANDPVLVQVRTPDTESPDAQAAIFVFNTGDMPVAWQYRLAQLGLPAPRYVYDWTAGQPWPAPAESVSGSLEPHDGALLFVSPAPFDAPPQALP